MARTAPQPANPAEPSYVGDEFWGVGGSYLVDPVTGKRSLIVEQEPATIQPINPDLEA
jgi:hypothetical protein